MKQRLGVIWVSVLALAACTTARTDDRNASPSAVSAPSEKSITPPAVKVTVPQGTRLRVVLHDGMGTRVSAPGSEFSAALAEPVVINGRTVLEKGSPIAGRIVDVRKSGRVKGRASLSLVLTSLVHDGKPIPIETRTYVGVAKNSKKRDIAIIGGAAGAGAVIGAITGGGKGAATGAVVGGAGGTGTVLITRGEDLHYPAETRLSFVLSKAVDL
jgi:hypothetical protein